MGALLNVSDGQYQVPEKVPAFLPQWVFLYWSYLSPLKSAEQLLLMGKEFLCVCEYGFVYTPTKP